MLEFRYTLHVPIAKTSRRLLLELLAIMFLSMFLLLYSIRYRYGALAPWQLVRCPVATRRYLTKLLTRLSLQTVTSSTLQMLQMHERLSAHAESSGGT